MSTAIIYARVSTEDQAEHGYSLIDQVNRCTLKAKDEGAEKIIPCVDEGYSGDLLARPGLMKARELLKTTKVNFFVCFDPDRLARKLAHQLILTDEIQKSDCKLLFVNFNWQNTSEGRLFYSLRGAIAEFEKEKIRERTMRGLRQKALQGGLTHNPDAYGYDYNPKTNSLIINEKEAEVYYLMSKWFLNEDQGYSAIARKLTNMGIPTKRGAQSWAATTISRILTNPLYKGELWLQRYNTMGKKNNKYLPTEEKIKVTEHPKEHHVLIKVPPIISPSTHAAHLKQAKRISRLSKTRGNYLLSGLLICGLCQSGMSGTKNAQRAYYRCNGRKACSLPYLRSKIAENAIWDTITPWLCHEVTLSSIKMETAEDGYELQVLQRQYSEAKKEYLRLIDLIQKGFLSLEDTAERLSVVNTRLNRLKSNLQKQLQEKPDNFINLKDHLLTKIKVLDFKSKQKIIRNLTGKIVVFPDHLVLHAKVPPFIA